MAGRCALTPAETAFVHAQRVARLATTSEDCRPHVVPICYAFDGRRFFTPLDEKPKRVSDRSLRRVRNIERQPLVSLVVDRYDDDWSRLGYVLIEGHAALLGPGDPEHDQALTLLRERYPQYRTMRLETRPVIAVTPSHVTSWGAATGPE